MDKALSDVAQPWHISHTAVYCGDCWQKAQQPGFQAKEEGSQPKDEDSQRKWYMDYPEIVWRSFRGDREDLRKDDRVEVPKEIE